MPTSTVIELGYQASNYTWDAITGLLYTAGLANFYVVILIILCTITIVAGFFSGLFKIGKK